MKLNKRMVKGVATTVVLAQLSLALQPLMAATQADKGASNPMAQSQLKRMQALQRDLDEAKARQAQANANPADQASARLAQVEELVRDIAFIDREGRPDSAGSGRPGQEQVRAIGPNLKAKVRPLTPEQKAQQQERRQQRLAELRELLTRQKDGQQAVREEFAQTRRMLIERKLPEVILARHDEAVKTFEQRVASFNQAATRVQQGDEAALGELQAFFDQNPTKRRAAPIDPKNLPWRTPEPTKRLPAETKTAWFQNLYGNQGTRVAQLGNSLAGLEFITPPEPGQAPTEADLAETPETQRTVAIVAKAQELGNNPVNIQNWVRNNVEWVPTWGAIQSAQDTLDKKRGNAIDIASLEIALLRAARIPARYQFGTIELPAEQVMNWVGGVTKPEAAQQLLGQGGIANRGLIEGGKISKIRMEHAWVQAYVNWAPSRGAKQGSATQHPSPVGPRNAWVPLDPSFKQYKFPTTPIFKNVVPLDLQVVLTAVNQGSTSSETGGWTQNLNESALKSQISDYQSRLSSYVQTQNPSPTTSAFIGKAILEQKLSSILESVLPYPVSKSGQQVSAIPMALEHLFVYRLYASDAGRALDDPILNYSGKTSELVGKRLTLSYVPASQSDADTLLRYLPAPHTDGSSIQPSEVPTSLPGYLIRLRPQITLDGKVVATSSHSFVMGTDLVSSGGFTQLSDSSQWDLTSEASNTVGQTTAIGISAGGISAEQLARLKRRLTSSSEILQGSDPVASAALTGEQVAGDLLVATIWNWFAAAEGHGRITQTQLGMVEIPGLSYGLFHTSAQPIESWGVIRQVKFPGLNLDIGHVRNLGWAIDNDAQKWSVYNQLRGQAMSALENSVPDSVFNNASLCNVDGSALSVLPACSSGISAMQAIAAAARDGQKIYTITAAVFRNNPNIVDLALSAHSFDTRIEVRAALDAGLEVTIHERPVVTGKWVGAGYVSIDPQTGAGGYLIEGGSNGGYKENLEDSVGIQLLSRFGVTAPPSSYWAPDLVKVYDSATLAIYSAVNTVNQIWDCYRDKLGDSVKTIVLLLAIATLVTALLRGGGVLGGAVVAALAILLIPVEAGAAPTNQRECEQPKIRIQFQQSPRENGTETYNTSSEVVTGAAGVGVTTLQVRSAMAAMFSQRPAWMPGGVDLAGMIIEISEKLKPFPPFGTDGRTRNFLRAQREYLRLFYRVDIENLSGVNLKE